MEKHYSPEASQQTSVRAVAWRYGLLAGLVSIIYNFILFISETESKALSAFPYLILIIGIVLAHKHFKKENGGYLTYGQGLGIGTLVSGIVGLLSGVFIYIYVNFIDENYLERMRDIQLSELERRGMSEEQIEQAMSITAKLMGPEMMVVWAFVLTLLIGFFLSLIIAAITKNIRPAYE